MRRIYIDETYLTDKTIIAFVILTDKQKNYISKNIVKLIKANERNAKTRSLLLSEFKSIKLRNTSFWHNILKIIKENIAVYGILNIDCKPKDKSAFTKKYASIVNSLHKEYDIPVVVDIINNKNFMTIIQNNVVKKDKFFFVKSETDKGIQIADIFAGSHEEFIV